MGVRLILVSVVAGLGLTIPSASQVKQWTESAQTWVYTRLAEMDARMPADASAFVYVADGPAVLAEEPTVIAENAAPSVPEPKKSVPTEQPAPSASAVVDIQKLADELAAGLELPSAPAALKDEPAPAPAPAPPVVAVETPAATFNDDAFLAAESDVIDAFVADATPSIPTLPETPKTLVAEVVKTPFEPIVWNSDILTNDPAETLAKLVAETFAGVPEAVVAVRPVAPIVVAEEISDADLAFVLEAESEGVDAPPAPAPAVVASPAAEEAQPSFAGRANQLSQAVRLTREAVYAWANLLHGPAVVTIAH